MFSIDDKDPTPLYAQLARAIRVAIASGRLDVGERLPTVRELAVTLRINANTVAKVYGELERAGVLETRRGVGTFVRKGDAGLDRAAERERHLAGLADHYLVGAAALGYTASEAIHYLKSRHNTNPKEQNDG